MVRDAASLAALLSDFTVDELLDEVGRRARALRAKVEGETLCNGCARQVFWKKRGEPPDSFNTCGLGHALEFKMPEDEGDDDYGFYRPGGCRDRAEPAPSAPPPAPPRRPWPPARARRPPDG